MEFCARKYLSSINPIASRIANDLEGTVAAFEHIWNKMEPSDRASALTDAIMDPEIVLKYLKMSSQMKTTYNDDPSSSASIFRWQTKSQLNLQKINDALPCGAFLGESSPPATSGDGATQAPPRPTEKTATITKPRAPPPPPPATKKPLVRPKPRQEGESFAAIVTCEESHNDVQLLVTPDDEDDSLKMKTANSSPDNEKKSLLCNYTDFDFLNNW
ncbi:hypothetical protein DMENIID0001_070420 [Sergentomyia squamirostris]